jgi:hypothetical protein
MNAQVPYLARLAAQAGPGGGAAGPGGAAGQGGGARTLRPPRRRAGESASAASGQGLPPEAVGQRRDQPVPGGAGHRQAGVIGAGPAEDAEITAGAGAGAGAGARAEASRAAAAAAGAPALAALTAAAATPVAPAPAGPTAIAPAGGAAGPPAAGPGAPRSWADPVWNAPAPLPLPPGTSGGTDHARDQDVAAATPSIRPAAAEDSRSSREPGRDPGDGRSLARSGPARARVSIGTIEVTVLPQPADTAAPAAGQRPARPVPAATPGNVRPRPPSLLASGPGAERLRDGLRRWHGTAQG